MEEAIGRGEVLAQMRKREWLTKERKREARSNKVREIEERKRESNRKRKGSEQK